MAVLVECICGRKYEVDGAQVKQFDCETCDRKLVVPTEAVSRRLQQIRERMSQGEPGVREGAREAAALQNPNALPLLRAAAESGVREAVNTALVGLTDADGEGRGPQTDQRMDRGRPAFGFAAGQRLPRAEV
jgi:hypothetical protein